LHSSQSEENQKKKIKNKNCMKKVVANIFIRFQLG